MTMIPLQAGPVRICFDPESGSLRYFEIAGEEVLRGIYAAARDPFWQTLPARIRTEQQEIRADSFSIAVEASVVHPATHLRWSLEFHGTSDGQFTIDFTCVPESAGLANRIGLCVLHALESSAGQDFQIVHSTGGTASGRFPGANRIAPESPATDIAALSWVTPRGVRVEMKFIHEQFEMEDQRNWGDHSFKTYGRPQSKPKPFPFKPGERIRQSIQLRLTPATTATPSVPVLFDHGTLPKIGLQLPQHYEALFENTIEQLSEIQPHHLRTDLRFGSTAWEAQIIDAKETARRIGAKVFAALFLTSNAEAELHAFRSHLDESIALTLIFGERDWVTPTSLARLARKILGPYAGLAAGTDAAFFNLHRQPPPPDLDWLPCFPLCSQAHLSDEGTLAENVPTIADQLNTLAQFCARPAVVSPLTLAARFPSDRWFSNAMPEWMEHPPHPGQGGLPGAAWLLAQLAWASTALNLFSITTFPTHGAGGVLTNNGEPSETWHLLKFLAHCSPTVRINLATRQSVSLAVTNGGSSWQVTAHLGYGGEAAADETLTPHGWVPAGSVSHGWGVSRRKLEGIAG